MVMRRRHRYSLWRQLKHSLLLELELELRRMGRHGKVDRLPTSGGGDGLIVQFFQFGEVIGCGSHCPGRGGTNRSTGTLSTHLMHGTSLGKGT